MKDGTTRRDFNKKVLAAAVGGMLAGSALTGRRALAGEGDGPKPKEEGEKHVCKGLNTCKGKGGCKTT